MSPKLWLLTGFLFVAPTFLVSGADLVWTNSAGGNWNTAANWSPNQVPGPSDNATLSLGVRVTNLTSVSVSNLTFTSGTFVGGGLLTVNGTSKWTGGDLCSSINVASGASLAISNSVSFGLNSGTQNGGGSLTNHGTVIWAGSTHHGYGGAVIHNSGVWQVVANNNLTVQNGTNTFINVGTLEKEAAGVATIGWEFNSTGTINTTNSGSASFTINNFVGDSVLLGEARLTFPTMKASLTVAPTATLHWSSGDLSGALTIAAGGTLTVSNSVSFGLNNGLLNGGGGLTNHGTVIWAGSSHHGYGGATIHNAGLWQIVANNSLTVQHGTNTFINSGTLEKMNGSGTVTIAWAFSTTGTVNTGNGSLILNDWIGNNTLQGAMTWSGGTMSGTLNVANGSVLYWSSGTVKGAITGQGTIHWSGGDLSGALTIASGGNMSISNTVSFGLNNGVQNGGGSLTNNGTVIFAGSSHYGYGGAVIHNAGLWQVVANNNLSIQNGTNTFINIGTLEKVAGTGSTTIGWKFNNTGTINTPTGSFAINDFIGTNVLLGVARISFPTLRASLTVAPNAVLQWLSGDVSGGALTIAPGGTLAISNTISFGNNGGANNGGGSLTNNGKVIWAGTSHHGYGGAVIHNAGLWQIVANNNLTVQSGTNTFINTGTLEKIAGTSASTFGWDFNTTGTVNTPSGSLAINNFSGNSVLNGVAAISFSNMKAALTVAPNAVMHCLGGDVNGALAVAAGGTLTVSNTISFGNNNGAHNGGGSLTNNGTVIWAATSHHGYGGSVIHNAGLWQIVANNSLTVQNGTNTFINSGTLEKISGAGASTISWHFNTTGTINTPTGSLSLNKWTGNSVMHGNADLNMGTMGASLAVSSNAFLNLMGGDVIGALTVNPGGTLSVSNTISFGNNGGGGNLTNNGKVIWAGTSHHGYGGAVIHNNGLWQIVANNSLSVQAGTNIFINAGTLQKTAGAGSSSIAWRLDNSGTIESRLGAISISGACIQTDGATFLNGGTVSFTQPFQLLGGELKGTNTVTGTITNSGVVRPGGSGPGLLTISGQYIQTASGRLDIQLGGTNVGSGFDRLAISGAATLNGALDVTLLDPYVPAVSNQFRVLTFASRTGDFNEVNGLVIFTNLALQANYLSSSLDLLAVSTNSPAAVPTILSQPQSKTIINGEDVSFSVAAAGTRPFHYQWQFNEANLPGENALSLALLNAQTNQSGNYRVIITNAAGAVTSSVATLTVRPVSDLVVTEVSHATNSIAGQSLIVSWRSLNQGNQTAIAPWAESVSISTNASGAPATHLGSFTISNSLASGQSIVRTQSVILPAGLNGNFYVVIKTDIGNTVVEELNETNNTTVSLAPLLIRSPDLKLSSIAAAASAEFTQPIPVSWVITNAGSAPVLAPWNDRVYLNTISNSISGGTLLTNVVVTNIPFAESTVVSNSASVTVPLTPTLPPGNYFLLVVADFGNAIVESVETNNFISKPITLSLPPLPDLVATNINAPANASSGQSVQITWGTTNQGNAVADGIWSETIYLTTNSAGAGAIELGTFEFTNSLNAGVELTRTQQVTIPISSPLGNLWFAIGVDSRNDIFESVETNNLRVATNATLVPAVLTLQFSAAQILEGTQPMSASVTRNGSRAAPLTVSLTNGDPTEVSIPAEIIIPSGQASASFNVTALSDGLVDGPQLVNITAAAIGFSNATAQVTVLDSDLPSLSMTMATNSVEEGESLAVSVSRDAGTNSAVTVTVSSSNPGQLSAPLSVTIPAGQSSTNFILFAVDNLIVEFPANYTVSVSASNYNGASTNVSVVDDDLPQAVLNLASGSVSENAGPQATVGTLLRTPATGAPIYFELESDDASSLLVPSLVVVPAFESSVSFPVAAVDNALLDGPRTVQVRFWIKTSAGGARVSEGTPVSLIVTDDDGPALKISFAQTLVPEGANPATTATVSRNTGTNGALLVNLSSSDSGEATVPVSVTIPAGATSAVFNVTTVDDAVSDGSKPVTITASAATFVSATALLTVTDVNQPDLIVSSIIAPASADTETFASIGYQIRNQGLNAMASNTIAQRIYLSTDPLVGGDLLMGEYTFGGGLPAGGQFSQTFSIRLPQAAGNYWVIAETDTSNSVSEILENNNTRISATPIQVNAAYDAVVSTTLNSAPANTPIPLTGNAFRSPGNVPVPFALVNIHINVRGTHRVISALANSAGNFSTTWQPLPGEAGFYEIGAAHPGFTNAATQDSFSLFGMNSVPSSPTLALNGTGSVTGAVQIVNAGDLLLTGISAQVVDPPPNLNFNLSLATTSLGGLETNFLNYTISSTDGLAAQGTVVVHLTSAQGAELDVPFSVKVKPLTPQLDLTPSPLVRGMKRGEQTFATFSVTNNGGAATGPITISLPPVSWMSLASQNPLPSLAPGEGTSVTLQLLAATNMPLTAFTGNLFLSANGSVASLPFEFRALSESKGDFKVTATDEFTYHATGAPKVTNAAAILRDAISGDVVTNGLTGASGEWFVAQLPEGYYELEVSANQHSSYKKNHFLSAGATNEVEAFLSRQTVRYTWTVVPTEIEDRYKIVVETEFEANVPAPVVTITPSVIDLADLEDVMQVDLKIENHGLIAAQNFELQFDEHEGISFEPLISKLGTLPAKSTFTVPLTIRAVSAEAQGSAARVLSGDCFATGRSVHEFSCGPIANIQVTTITFPNAGDCIPGIPLPSFGWLSGGGGGGSSIQPIICVHIPQTPRFPGFQHTSGGSGNNFLDLLEAAVYQAIPALAIPNPCDPECLKQLIPAIYGCTDLPQLPDLSLGPCLSALGTCAKGVLTSPSQGTAVNCLAAGITCGIENGVKKVPGVECLFDILEACAPEEERGRRNGFGARNLRREFSGPYAGLLGTLETRVDRLLALRDHYLYLYGDSVWIETDEQSLVGAFMQQYGNAINEASDSGAVISSSERTTLLNQTLPGNVTATHVNHLADRWNRSIAYWQAGIFTLAQVPPGDSTDFLAVDEVDRITGAAAEAVEESELEGFTSLEAGINTAKSDLIETLTGGAGGICAKVKLQLDQEAVLSRDAFKATLEIDNREGNALENISVTIGVFDTAGHDASSLFSIQGPQFTTIAGTNGSGALPTNQTGQITWTLVPTTDAAPTNETAYFVSGGLSYVVDGNVVSVPLSPASITVHPSPRLDLKYFHQRDVFSDDPRTDIVEPAIPYSLAVMAQNSGYGTAKNFRITSAQPKIVENEKGLLIDFKIIATEVAGQNLQPTLTADMGNILPGTNAIARWLMTSTLQGLFIDYNATFEHVDGLGNPKLSLIDSVSIHEMIHVVSAGGAFADGRPDFLVNDVPDLQDFPDTIYLSSGATNPVQVVTNASSSGSPSPGNLQVQLDAAMPGGWAYLRVPDPANGQYRLVNVLRSDSVTILVETNAWVTDRTFLGLGKQPTRENILHLLDYNSTGSYTLIYELNPALDITPPTSAMSALPAESSSGIVLNWSGADNVGVAFYDIYVSENGGTFSRWLANAVNTSAIFQGTFGNNYSFYSVGVDGAGNREAAPPTPDAQTTVTHTNHAPVLAAITNLTIVEGQTLALNIEVSDPDNDGISLSLGAGSPSGLLLNSQNRLLTWTTSEAHGPGTNNISIIARDNGIPQLSATQTFTVIVLESNTPPILALITNRTVSEGKLLKITNSAVDFDLPAQQLTFSLGAGAPTGAAINSTNGIFSWQPNEFQGGTTNLVSIIVSDSGVPSLSATQTVTIVAFDTRPDFILSVGTTHLLSGASGSVPLLLNSGADLTNVVLDFKSESDRLINLHLANLSPQVGAANLFALESNRFSVHFQSGPDGALQGEFALAQLGFDTIPNEHSAVAHLRGEALDGHRASSPTPLQGSANSGRVFIIGEEPILDPFRGTNNQLGLVLYARTGESYSLERRDALGITNDWMEVDVVAPSQLQTFISPQPINASTEFFRIRYLPSGAARGLGDAEILEQLRSAAAEPVRIFVPTISEGDFLVRFAAASGVTYRIEYADSLSSPDWIWKTNLVAPSDFEQGVGILELRETVGAEQQRYYRILQAEK